MDIHWEAEVLPSASSRPGHFTPTPTPTPRKESPVPNGWEAGWYSVPIMVSGRTISFDTLTMMELRFVGRSLVTISTELSHLTTKGSGDRISKLSSSEEGRFILRWRKRNNIPCTKISRRAVADIAVHA